MSKKNEKDFYEAIIDKIRKIKMSTTTVADSLGKKGVIDDIYPISRGQFVVGRVFLSYGYNESNWETHELLRDVKKGDVVVVETHNCDRKAVFGELVSTYVLKEKGAAAIVVNGYMRDAQALISHNMPIWCKALTPIGCFNRKNESPMNKEILEQWKKKYEGAIAVCDDSGVVIIPKENINQEFLEKLDFLELQEEIWFYCTGTKKWSTYDTVCLKKYLDTKNLSPELRERFERFTKK